LDILEIVVNRGCGPVAQWQSRGLLILVSKVRSLPGSQKVHLARGK
jgi:hypothetical protein